MIINVGSLEQAMERMNILPNRLNQFTVVIDTRPTQLELFEEPKPNSGDFLNAKGVWTQISKNL